MNKYILHVDTNWCGEDNDYAIICSNPDHKDIQDFCQMRAYENFADFSGIQGILEELFPDSEEYTEEQENEAIEVENDYYGFTLEEFNGTDEEWDWYELIYDESDEEN